jgi:hypothetical protein
MDHLLLKAFSKACGKPPRGCTLAHASPAREFETRVEPMVACFFNPTNDTVRQRLRPVLVTHRSAGTASRLMSIAPVLELTEARMPTSMLSQHHGPARFQTALGSNSESPLQSASEKGIPPSFPGHATHGQQRSHSGKPADVFAFV